VPSLNLPNFIEVSGSESLYSYKNQVDLEMHHTIEEDGYISPEYEEDDIVVEEQPKPLAIREKQPIVTSKPLSTPQNIKKEIKRPQNTEDDKLYDFSS